MSAESVLVREVTVGVDDGLHVRPLVQIVQLAQRFKCRLRICHGERAADASSMLDLMTLGAEKGAIVRLEADGDQATEALDALEQLFVSNFPLEPRG